MSAPLASRQELGVAWLKAALELVSALGGAAAVALQTQRPEALSIDGCADALARVMAEHISNHSLGDVPTSETVGRVERWVTTHAAALAELAKDADVERLLEAERTARAALSAPLSKTQRDRVLDWLNHALWLLAALDAHAIQSRFTRPTHARAFRACTDGLGALIQHNVGARDYGDVAWSDMLAQVVLWEAEHSAALTELTKYEDVRPHFVDGSSAALMVHLEASAP